MNKQKRFFTLFPLYLGLSIDLLFWIVIDSLFLSVVKGLTLAQIASLSTISLLVCIVFQYPFLRLIKRIGNTRSVQLGSLLFLIASLLFTFGNHYIVIVIGHIAYDVSFIFRNMANVMLKNNLTVVDKEDQFVQIKTKCNMIYACVTTIISLVAGFLFALDPYLPMYLCIASCIFTFSLSILLEDVSPYNKVVIAKSKEKSFSFRPFILLCLVYGLFFSIIYIGQPDIKIVLQETLLSFNTVATSSMILSIILFLSRILRLLSNYFYKVYHRRLQNKMAIILPILLFVGLCFAVGGSFASQHFVLAVVLVSIGYCIFLFVRDPFSIYVQDYLLSHCEKTHHQTVLTLLEYFCKVIEASISLCFTLLLLHFSMSLIILLLCLLSMVEIVLASLLLIKIKKHNE